MYSKYSNAQLTLSKNPVKHPRWDNNGCENSFSLATHFPAKIWFSYQYPAASRFPMCTIRSILEFLGSYQEQWPKCAFVQFFSKYFPRRLPQWDQALSRRQNGVQQVSSIILAYNQADPDYCKKQISMSNGTLVGREKAIVSVIYGSENKISGFQVYPTSVPPPGPPPLNVGNPVIGSPIGAPNQAIE